MSHIQKKRIAPFISIFILVVIGLSYVFVKMEAVRAGYDLLRLGRLTKIAAGDKAEYELIYARLTRPERLDQIGTHKLSLVRAQRNQVVLMAAQGTFAVRQ
jgi:hypothetical protein